MGKVKREDIKPGMVISKPVTNAQGGILIPKGAALAESHIRLLKVWSIKEVFIQGAEDASNKVNLHKKLAEKRTEMEFIFKGMANDPMMTLIKNIAKKQIVREVEQE